MSKLRLDIVVGGRFHSDHLASALLAAGHDVKLYTSLPRLRFPTLPDGVVRSFVFPELVAIAAARLGLNERGEAAKMELFGRACERHIRRDADAIYAWSGFALESFRRFRGTKILIRDSTHIDHQYEVLKREYEARGIRHALNPLAPRREREEYELADRIVLLSHIAERTFLERGVTPEKLKILSLGADTSVFSPGTPRPANLPLRVVFFGFICVRKGVLYLLEAARALPPGLVKLTLVGPVEKSLRSRVRSSGVVHLPSMSHRDLAAYLRTQDVFVLPSLEDGFAMTIPQAMAAGLVPVVSDQCGASELVQPEKNGLILPSRDASKIAQALERLARDPGLVARLREGLEEGRSSRDWSAYHHEVQASVPALREALRKTP